MNVRGGSEQTIAGGRHTITIGATPGARIAGLLVVGAAGHGNCAATMSVPGATWIVDPFWAGVTVIVPCAVLGDEAGVGDGGCDIGDGECGGEADVGAGGDGALEVLPETEPEAEPEAEPESDGVPVAAP